MVVDGVQVSVGLWGKTTKIFYFHDSSLRPNKEHRSKQNINLVAVEQQIPPAKKITIDLDRSVIHKQTFSSFVSVLQGN